MAPANEMRGRTLENGRFVLLARIVDRFGRSIQADDVTAIEVSLYEVDPRWLGDGTVVGRHEGISLDVQDVIHDSLQNDGGWSVDGVGYNFRHELDLGEKMISPDADALVEIRYVLTPFVGEKTIVRFRVKVV